MLVLLVLLLLVVLPVVSKESSSKVEPYREDPLRKDPEPVSSVPAPPSTWVVAWPEPGVWDERRSVPTLLCDVELYLSLFSDVIRVPWAFVLSG